jgi:hypothetical protein
VQNGIVHTRKDSQCCYWLAEFKFLFTVHHVSSEAQPWSTKERQFLTGTSICYNMGILSDRVQVIDCRWQLNNMKPFRNEWMSEWVSNGCALSCPRTMTTSDLVYPPPQAPFTCGIASEPQY